MIEENNIFKLAGTTYDFKDMKFYSHKGVGRLQFHQHGQKLYRLAANRYQLLSPTVTEAYLDYTIDNILLGNNDD